MTRQLQDLDRADARLPVTILTGFLGAGKTSLLQRILNEPHGLRIAVIENEFGQTSVDADLLFQDREAQIIELNNGCICCQVRGDLVRILGQLQQRRAQGELHFDRVIIETTGLADPAPVAQTFFVEDSVARHYQLDAIVTVVDALHGDAQLEAHHEALEQVAFADRLLLSKSDLVTTAQRDALLGRLRAINPRTPVALVDFGRTEIGPLLDVRGFSLESALALEPDFLQEDAHAHDESVRSFVFSSARAFDPQRITDFFQTLIEQHGTRLMRYKGVLNYAGFSQRVVLQGVHMVLNSDVGAPWGEAPRASHLVFIGRDLPQAAITEALTECLQ